MAEYIKQLLSCGEYILLLSKEKRANTETSSRMPSKLLYFHMMPSRPMTSTQKNDSLPIEVGVGEPSELPVHPVMSTYVVCQ